MMEDFDLFPLWLSLKTASISTVVVLLVGVFLAYVISRRTFVGKSVVEAISLLRLVLLPSVVGFALLYLFGKNGVIGELLIDWFDVQIVFTWYGALIAAIVVSFPLMYQSASAAFKQYDANIENAARTIGKTKWQVFRTISFPL